MLKYIVVFAGASLLAISLPAKAQEQRDIVALSSEEIMTFRYRASKEDCHRRRSGIERKAVETLLSSIA